MGEKRGSLVTLLTEARQEGPSWSSETCYPISGGPGESCRHQYAEKQKQVFFIKAFIKSSFRFTAKLRGWYRDLPYMPCPYICMAFPVINIPHQRGMFVKSNRPTQIYCNYPKSIVYFRVHYWCCLVLIMSNSTCNQPDMKQIAMAVLEETEIGCCDPRSDRSYLGTHTEHRNRTGPDKLDTCFSFSLSLNIGVDCSMAESNCWFLGDVATELFKMCLWEIRWLDDGRLTLSTPQEREKAVTIHWTESVASWTACGWDQDL